MTLELHCHTCTRMISTDFANPNQSRHIVDGRVAIFFSSFGSNIGQDQDREEVL
jgi:hypothetical protein